MTRPLKSLAVEEEEDETGGTGTETEESSKSLAVWVASRRPSESQWHLPHPGRGPSSTSLRRFFLETSTYGAAAALAGDRWARVTETGMRALAHWPAPPGGAHNQGGQHHGR